MSMSEAHTLEERGRRLRKAGNLVEAERVLKQCISILETRQGREGCKHMCDPLYELVFCLTLAGRQAEAEPIVTRCLSIQEAHLGPASKHCSQTIQMAANLLLQAGRKEEAVGMFKRCLTIQEAEMGRHDVRLAATLLALGECLWPEGKLNEAEAVLRRCLAIVESTMGGGYNPTRTTRLNDEQYQTTQHVFYSTLNALGGCLRQAGRLEDAEGMLRRSLTIQETKLARRSAERGQSQDDLSVALGHMLATTLNSLGACLLQASKIEAAEGVLRRCLMSAELYRDSLLQNGFSSVLERQCSTPLLWSTLGLLGTCILQAKKIEEAEQVLRRCLATAESVGRESLEVASSLQDLSRCLRQTQPGKFAEAEELLRRCLEIREAKLGADDHMVVVTQQDLGMFLLQDVMRPQEAERILRHCLGIQDAKLDPSDIPIENTMWPLAACLSQVGKLEEARRILIRCLATQEAKLGRDHVYVAFTLYVLGLHLRQSGELEEAEEKFKRCLAIHEAKLEQDTFMVASTQLELGICRRSRDHERWGLEVRPSRGLSVGGSTLHILDQHDWEYEALCDQFKTRWLKFQPSSGVSIARIFSIQMPLAVRNKHDWYNLSFGVKPSQLFHGTSCDQGCNFIVNPQEEAPCGLSSCSVCNICMLGFQLRENVARTAVACNIPLRYGKGIYFSSVSGKANDYAKLSTKTAADGRKLRCMFVAHVERSKVYTTKERRLPQAECPPLGYHSVEGEVGPALNYDEFVVYKEEAALPTHLIVYSPP